MEQKIPYTRARQQADRIYELLAPSCELIHIAGSIRRERGLIKDIEIVCIPKKTFRETGLFGEGDWIVSPDFSRVLENVSKQTIKGRPSGRYMQLLLKTDINLDVFMPDVVDYYRQLAIRTGSADYAHMQIAHAWKKKGWCGSDQGLRLSKDCMPIRDRLTGKITSYKCINVTGERPPIWKSEEELFDWLNIPYIHPRNREIPKSINAAL